MTRLSVIVPVLDDPVRVGSTVARLRRELATVADEGGLEIVVVDDGSSDATADAARNAGADRVLVHEQNRGKGAAVRTGVMAASGATIAFTDIDLSYSPDQLLALLAEIENGADVAVGSRRHGDAVTLVRATPYRRVTSRLFNVATVLTMGIWADTQCGVKAFRHDVARRLFGAARLDGFAFDVELFHLARRWGLDVRQVPVTLTSSDVSSVRLRGELLMLWDLARLRLLTWRRAYGGSRGPLP
ncbi:MAG TPA: glycosyltransferase [Acidimicrobiales bacterium]|nr:glycosyltransferase [Acidimicrobiales bacterium]